MATDFIARYLLRRARLEPNKDVTLLPLGSPPNIVSGLLAGTAEGGLLADDFVIFLPDQFATGILLILLTVLNAFLGVNQEGKAEASVAALQKMMVVKAKVRRNGEMTELPMEDLVPGDIVNIEAGDLVPADGRITRAATLEIDESALTGESAPVPKGVDAVPDDAALGDRVDMAFMNTQVTRGAATFVVTSTGMATEVGHISGMLSAQKAEETPLTKQLNRLTQTIIVKDVRSPERLYDQVALWLHRKVSDLPQPGRETVQRLNDPNTLLAGKRVLIVDDDVRNIFAMTSLLERHHMDVMSAEQGETALQLLKDGSAFDIVLMDIMMPEMDGYEVMKTIRGRYGFQELPIIALTAKAMKGDREKCIAAGASDYISKPVDPEQLLGLLRIWLHR